LIFVTPRQRDYRADFSALSESRGAETADLLRSATRNVFRAYDRYLERSADASRIRRLRANKDTLAALESNYELLRSRTGYGELLEVTNGRCPMCGFGEASTLDHYLPRSVYPEFSVLALNLLPACARCNLLKGHAVGRTPSEQFLHCFFHQVPSIPLLVCNVDVRPGTLLVEFRIRPIRRIDPDILARVSSHFHRLHLANRFRRETLNEIGDRRATFDTFVGNGNHIALRHRLRDEARGFLRTLGPNHWKTALYSALHRNRDFWTGGFRNVQ
jgi:hypothetical protein